MTDRREDQRFGIAAELLLLAVHIAVAIGFLRIFSDTSFLRPLLVTVVVVDILAIATRRLGVPAPATVILSPVVTVLVIVWTLFSSTTNSGVPTAATLDAIATAFGHARTEFSEVIAPTRPTSGFVLLVTSAMAVAVWFADWAAFRLRATLEALAPSFILFLFASLLGSGEHRLLSVALFALTALGFVAAHRAWRNTGRVWLGGSIGDGPSMRRGLVVAVLASVLGLLAGPLLPGADADPILRWRRRAPATAHRSTVSPMVSLKPRLVNQADTELFQVRADEPSYWRLTGLDEFDGTLWRIDSTFAAASGSLPPRTPTSRLGRPLTQEIAVQGLGDLWIPAALEAVLLGPGDDSFRWDADSSTLIIDRDRVDTNGIRYEVTSVVPDIDPRALAAAPDDTPTDLARFTDLPADFPDEVRDLARDIAPPGTGRYEAMLALQSFFRTEFDYSTDVPEGHDDNALLAFLDRRIGYCEQFAGTFAAMARSLDVPARVGVGFTPGEPVPNQPGLYQVRGRHAHAWPEVHFTGIGWVPFEPTPGRGLALTEPYTGVPESQDLTMGEEPEPLVTTTTLTSTPAGGSSAEPATPNNRRADSEQRPDTGSEPSSALPAILLAVLALAVAAGAVVVVRIRRRGEVLEPGPRRDVIEAWDHTVARIGSVAGVCPEPSETRIEFADRIGGDQCLDSKLLRRLADLATRAEWAPGEPAASNVAEARQLATELDELLRARRSGEPASV